MTKTGTRTEPPPNSGRIVDIDVSEEMRSSFLEYAYSVIYSRALPDARDGMKPVQRRILYQMSQLGLRPDRGHVKCARVVGEVMGRLHPHGDSAIYDALVRMAQPFALRLPFVDGHGNFGSLDDGPAAMRYTECRLAPAAETMTTSLDEDVVDYKPNYDGRETEPEVLPAAVPALLINGATGIAVGMATNMAPHNVGETCRAAALLLTRPEASLDDVMREVPGPDFPTGGMIIGLAGVRQAYENGRGSFRLRARTSIEQVTPRRQGIVVTALPFNVGPERLAERIRELVSAKKIDGIANLVDLTDGDSGLNFVIEIKAGFSAEAVRDELFRLTPLEETFNVNNVALVEGQPRTLGLLELLRVFVDHRLEVVRRRCEFRRTRARQRLHLVEGMLIAVLDIDEVVAVIRSSDNAAAARVRLMDVFDLSEAQANHILDMPLRRLTKYSQIELEAERNQLASAIAELTGILENEEALRSTVRTELLAVAAEHDTPRRTELFGEGAPTPVASKRAPAALEVADAPCVVVLTSSGHLARLESKADEPLGRDPLTIPARSSLSTTTRSQLGIVTSAGTIHRISVLDIPTLQPTASTAHASAPVVEYAKLAADETAIGLANIGPDAAPLALGTAGGLVKRVLTEGPRGRDTWELISLRPGDSLIGAGAAPDGAQLVFITTDAHLLRFGATTVRTQGRTAGGMAGIKLSPDARALAFTAIESVDEQLVLTVAGSTAVLAGTGPCSLKVSALAAFPAKGRATGGVRCHRLTKGEDALLAAQVASQPMAESASGKPVDLPEPARRDAGGTKLPTGIAVVGST
ncbi:MAG: DNA topoisomerase IV subunit A [Candidatus Nanopelagicales bacterium]|nr:DNA topoisomerase IV subunit A [Candidatus Nanopelagicales bacterium]